MFLAVYFGKFKMWGVFALLVGVCVYPQYRYKLVDFEELFEVPGYEHTDYGIKLPESEVFVTIRVKRERWEEDARWSGATVQPIVGENWDDRSNAGWLRFRRHNIKVVFSYPQRPSASDHEKIVELAHLIDQRIQNLEGTKISFDTIGNRAFLAHIKPMFKRDGIFKKLDYYVSDQLHLLRDLSGIEKIW